MQKTLRDAYKSDWLEYLIFNLFAFAVILAIAFFFQANLKPLHPIKKSLEDFAFTDIYYKLNKPDPSLKKDPIPVQPELFIVNIGNLDRHGLAEVIGRIHDGNPAIVSMDVLFHEDADTTGSTYLQRALSSLDVNASIIQAYISADGIYCADGTYSMEALRFGEQAFINLPGKDPVSEQVRHFKPFHQKDVSLSVQTGLSYLEMSGKTPNKRQKKLMNASYSEAEKCYSKKKYTIRYNRLLSGYYNSQQLTYKELLHPDFDVSRLNGKIVLLGFRGALKDDAGFPSLHQVVEEDMYFTPLNQHLTGRSYPDMYGVDVQAQIISNVLQGNYIVHISKTWSWVLAFILSMIFTPLMVHFFVRRHIWFHIVAKLLQLAFSIVMVYVSIVLFGKGWQLNIKPVLISAILIVDLMYFYDAFVKYFAVVLKKRGITLHSVFLEEH